jgi:hypothetical protein
MHARTTHRDLEAGATGILGVVVLGALVVLALASTVLLATVDPPPALTARIHEVGLHSVGCPPAVAHAALEGVPRSCRSLVVENTGEAGGTAMCALVNDDIGATATFADNGIYHHEAVVAAGDTSTLLVAIDGTIRHHDMFAANCAVPPSPS